jgi:oligopeptide transport system ATP-binding protein
MQMIFQDPYASLNPRKRVGSIIGDPLKIHKIGTKSERKRRVQELLEIVGLSPEHYNRFPHEFSGGQRQRIGVARALALKPKLIVADEPVSRSTSRFQSQILNLLKDLQNEFDLTYLFIAHDLGVVRHVSDRISVMYLGKMVELSPAEELYQRPIMPYTEALLSAVPIPDPDLAAGPGADRPHRRRPLADQPAAGLPLQPPVPVHDRRLPRDRASADRLRRPLAACHHPLNVSVEEAPARRRGGREPGVGPGRRHPAGARRQGISPGLRGNPSFGVAPSKEGLEEGRYVVSDGRCRAQGDPEPLRGPHSSFRRAGLAPEERRCLGRGDPVQRPAPRARAGADDA